MGGVVPAVDDRLELAEAAAHKLAIEIS